MTTNICGILEINHENGVVVFRQTHTTARSEELLIVTGLGKIPLDVDTIHVEPGSDGVVTIAERLDK